MTPTACDFDILGIPAGEWSRCLFDSRLLDFDTWLLAWGGFRPARIPEGVWMHTAKQVYTEGPLAYYRATHVN